MSHSLLTAEEKADLETRLNDVELQLIEAKEFSHLSSEVFELLQTQIDEIKTLILEYITPSSQKTKENEPLMYF